MSLFSLHLSGKDKVSLIGNIATMLQAGIPILETVESLLEESKGNYRKVLEALQADLKAGNHIYVSFSKYPGIFNTVTINLIKASEEAGTLETTLKDIQRNIQKEMEFQDKVVSAMTYPAFIMMVFFAVFSTILLFVVPKISGVFLRLQVELPLPTRIMLALSNFLTQNKLLVILSVIGIGILLYLLYQTQRKLLFSVLFSLPILSTLVKQIDLTQFSRSLGLLLGAGLPIATALELAQQVVVKKEVADLLDKTRKMVISGKPFSEGLRSKKGIFPSMMVKLIEVGEKSGSLAKSMDDISVNLDYEVSKTLKTATALLEPIMLVMVGLGVGGLMMAIISPIYGLIGQVGGGG